MKVDRLAQLQQLLEAEPGDAFLKYGIAMEYRSRGEMDKALDWFERILQEHPDYLPLYYQMGMSYVEMGDEDAAVEVLQKGKEIAANQQDRKTLNEITDLLDDLSDEDDW